VNKFTPKKAHFVLLYLKPGSDTYFNATKSAIGAGYSKKTARSIGQRLLTNVDIAAAIAEAQKTIAERVGITLERWLQELCHSGFLDPIDLFEDDGSLKLIKNMPESARRAINGLEVTEIFDAAEGDQKMAIGLLKKIKLISKNDSLEKIGKHLGYLKEEVKHSGNINIGPSYEEVRKAIAAVEKET